VEEANGKLFTKGVPKGVPAEEVGRITEWKTEGNLLSLVLESGGYTRAHDALFRFRKQIGPTLGKFRMGIRDIEVDAFIVSLTGAFPEGFSVPRLPFIRFADLKDGTLTMDLAVSASDLENRIPDRPVGMDRGGSTPRQAGTGSDQGRGPGNVQGLSDVLSRIRGEIIPGSGTGTKIRSGRTRAGIFLSLASAVPEGRDRARARSTGGTPGR
jgi:hypothetical protein